MNDVVAPKIAMGLLRDYLIYIVKWRWLHLELLDTGIENNNCILVKGENCDFLFDTKIHMIISNQVSINF